MTFAPSYLPFTQLSLSAVGPRSYLVSFHFRYVECGIGDTNVATISGYERVSHVITQRFLSKDLYAHRYQETYLPLKFRKNGTKRMGNGGFMGHQAARMSFVIQLRYISLVLHPGKLLPFSYPFPFLPFPSLSFHSLPFPFPFPSHPFKSQLKQFKKHLSSVLLGLWLYGHTRLRR